MSKPEVENGLEQLREILVGAIQRDLERRVSRAESHSNVRERELQQETKQRLEIIETHMRTKAEALADRIDKESFETKEAIRALTKAQQELRDQLLQQAKVFLDELHRVRTEVLEALDRELNALENDLAGEGTRRVARDEASPAAQG